MLVSESELPLDDKGRNQDREKDQGNAQDQFAGFAVRGTGDALRGGGRLLTHGIRLSVVPSPSIVLFAS